MARTEVTGGRGLQGHGPLVDRFWAAGADAGLLRPVVLAASGVLLLTLSAKLQVPFYPVPMTLQTLVVLLIGAAYGWRLAPPTVALYLCRACSARRSSPTRRPSPPSALFHGPDGRFLIGFVRIGRHRRPPRSRRLGPLAAAARRRGAGGAGRCLRTRLPLARAVRDARQRRDGVGAAKAWAVVQGFLLGDLLKAAIAVAQVTAFDRKGG